MVVSLRRTGAKGLLLFRRALIAIRAADFNRVPLQTSITVPKLKPWCVW